MRLCSYDNPSVLSPGFIKYLDLKITKLPPDDKAQIEQNREVWSGEYQEPSHTCPHCNMEGLLEEDDGLYCLLCGRSPE